MRTVNVDFGGHGYPIYIGRGLLSNKPVFARHVLGRQVMLVTNQTVADLYLGTVLPALADFEVHTKILPDGEQYKNLQTLNLIFDALLEIPCDRRTTIAALGGGVIGDIAGFAAACYQRGIGLIQVPTTLLAQVDSSVGGKTAVNHARGKNMIGSFYQPAAVVADISTLISLPDRELRAGIAEVIKYGLIRDYEFFCWLEENIDKLLDRDLSSLIYCVERSCRNKADVVIADEREQGDRALLNLGHTFGHAIETATGYGTWLHGEAVAAGMVMAADLSLRLRQLSTVEFDRIAALIHKARLPDSPPGDIAPGQFLQLMAVDKKVDSGNIRLVLLRAIGQAYLCRDYPSDKLDEMLQVYSRR